MTTQTIPTAKRPIGFWLKLLDRLIEENLDSTLASAELTRRHWQVLNVLEQGGATKVEVQERLRPFIDESTTIASVLAALQDRGWVTTIDGPWGLTDAGRDSFKVLLQKVSASRQRLMNGIDTSEYQSTVEILEKMARNLGWY